MNRIDDYHSFWPHYLGEHRQPLCRWLHFVGTSGFFAFLIACLAQDPVGFGAVTLAAIAVGAVGWQAEASMNAAPFLLAMVGLLAWANPLIIGGVLVAYAFAWCAHFGIEGNRPATFRYPLWSLGSDFRMYGWMLRGQLWRGGGAVAGSR
jgi:hypothetical protein